MASSNYVMRKHTCTADFRRGPNINLLSRPRGYTNLGHPNEIKHIARVRSSSSSRDVCRSRPMRGRARPRPQQHGDMSMQDMASIVDAHIVKWSIRGPLLAHAFLCIDICPKRLTAHKLGDEQGTGFLPPAYGLSAGFGMEIGAS